MVGKTETGKAIRLKSRIICILILFLLSVSCLPSFGQASSAVGMLNSRILDYKILANYAALEAASPLTSGMRVYVQGYASAGDGADGFWQWAQGDSTTADGGTVLASTVVGASGRWKRIFDGHTFSARWYGAKGDGTTDDTTAIQNAMNAASTANGVLQIPAATYRVNCTQTNVLSRKCVFLIRSNLTVQGMPGATLKVVDNAGDYHALFEEADSSVQTVNFTLRDITIDQNPTGNTTCNISPTNPQLGLYVTNFSGIKILNCRFAPWCGTNAIDCNGASIANCGDVLLDGNTLQFVRGFSTNSGGNYDNSAIYVETNGTAGHRIINNNLASDMSQHARGGIESHGGRGVITGNVIIGQSTGINVVDTAGSSGLSANTTNTVVSNNSIYQCNAGIMLWPAANKTFQNVNVVGNTVWVANADWNDVTSAGIGFVNDASSTGSVDGVNISNNTIRFEQESRSTYNNGYTSGTLDAGNSWGISLAPRGGPISNCRCQGNVIINAPIKGIYIGLSSGFTLSGLVIRDNLIVDAGNNTLSPIQGHRAAILAGGNLRDVEIANNTIRDTGASNVNGFQSLWVNPGAAHNVSVHDNNIQTMAGGLVYSVDNTIVPDTSAGYGYKEVWSAFDPPSRLTPGVIQGTLVKNGDPLYGSGDPAVWKITSGGTLIGLTDATGVSAWAATTAYSVGNKIHPLAAPNNRQYRCTTAGTSGGSEPAWANTDAEVVTDGTVVWTEVPGPCVTLTADSSGSVLTVTDTTNVKVNDYIYILHTNVQRGPYQVTAKTATTLTISGSIGLSNGDPVYMGTLHAADGMTPITITATTNTLSLTLSALTNISTGTSLAIYSSDGSTLRGVRPVLGTAPGNVVTISAALNVTAGDLVQVFPATPNPGYWSSNEIMANKANTFNVDGQQIFPTTFAHTGLQVGATTSGNNQVAVLGLSDSSTGVAGTTNSGTGVFGTSGSSTGVRGNSTTGLGGSFQSTVSTGLQVSETGANASDNVSPVLSVLRSTSGANRATGDLIKVNDTASNSGTIAGQLINLQVSSSTKFSVDRSGNVSAAGNIASAVQTLTYGANVGYNCSLGWIGKVTVTDGNAFNITLPTNPVTGQTITYDILNSSGGAMGVITWNAAFKRDSSYANPANGKRRTIRFYYDGTNWVQQGAASGDM